MVIDKVLNREKQKKRYMDEIITAIGEAKTKKKREEALKEKLMSFYDGLVKMPFPFQIAESRRWMELMQLKEAEPFEGEKLFTGLKEKKAFKYICDISGMEPDFEEEKDAIKQKAAVEKEEINKLMAALDASLVDKLTARVGRLAVLRLESYK